MKKVKVKVNVQRSDTARVDTARVDTVIVKGNVKDHSKEPHPTTDTLNIKAQPFHNIPPAGRIKFKEANDTVRHEKVVLKIRKKK